ncbi:7480_t:CDS:2, partial [Funneliformis caledonium]
MDTSRFLRKEEEIIRDLKSELYKRELELEGVKTLNESLKNKITLMTNNEIELEHLKRESARLRNESVKSHQEKDDVMSLNYTLSEQVKNLQEEVNNLKIGRVVNTEGGLVCGKVDEGCVNSLFYCERINGSILLINSAIFIELVHHNVRCDSCSEIIKGFRYKCGHCADFDLCAYCVGSEHNNNHVFLKIRNPIFIDSRIILLPPFRYRSIHEEVGCDICGQNPIHGIRYKCGQCANFDICSKCEENISESHDQSHLFIRLNRPIRTEARLVSIPLLPNFLPD